MTNELPKTVRFEVDDKDGVVSLHAEYAPDRYACPPGYMSISGLLDVMGFEVRAGDVLEITVKCLTTSTKR